LLVASCLSTLRAVGNAADAGRGRILRFDVPTPVSNASGLKLTAEAVLAMRMEVPSAHLALGYRVHHLSNAGRGAVDPGIYSHVAYLGLWIH
jgi:hypothetical protein